LSGTAEAGVPERLGLVGDRRFQLAEHAKRRGVQLAPEPEPSMLVDDMATEVLKKHITSACLASPDIGHGSH
jgi:hypothetical protein